MPCRVDHTDRREVRPLFPKVQQANEFRIVSVEIDDGLDGRHIPFSDEVLTCPECHIIIAWPFDPCNLPRARPVDKRVWDRELALNRRHQR